MITLIICTAGSLTITFSVFILENYVIGLPSNSKFKQWWRKHVVGEYPNV